MGAQDSARTASIGATRLGTTTAVPTPASPADRSSAGFRSVLSNRRYLRYQSSVIVASTGYSVYAISIPWLAFQYSRSLLVVGLVLFVEVGIYALTFLVAPLVDRAEDKRVFFLVGFPIQAVAAITLAVTAARGELTLPLLLGLVVVLSVAWIFEWAVFQVAPRILLSKDELFAAQGISSAFGGGATLGGFAAGAGFILVTGVAASGYLYAALLLVATGLAAGVPLRGARSAERRYLASFLEGWAYLRSPDGRPLLQLGVLDAVVGFLATAPPLLITVFSGRAFPNPGLAYATMFTSFVVGGVAVDLTLGHLNPRRHVGVVLLGALGLAAIALTLAGVTPPSLGATAAAWAFAGGALGGYTNAKFTYQWGYVPGDRLARVTGNLYLFPGASGAAGALVLGALAGALSGRELTELVAAVLGGAVVFALLLPAVRRFSF